MRREKIRQRQRRKMRHRGQGFLDRERKEPAHSSLSPFPNIHLFWKKKKNQKQTKKIMETPNRTDIHFAVVEMSDTGLRFQ